MSHRVVFDVDIDVKPGLDRTIYGTRAMIYNESLARISPHPAGIYFHDVPIDKVTGLCAFDYKYGNSEGHPKVDILNNTAYSTFSSKNELLDTLTVPVNWDLFKDESIVKTLPHIGKHFDLVRRVKPESIEDIADILALIRPGKLHLVDSYLHNKERVRKTLYKRSSEAYFKKSHSISYATMIIVVLNRSTNRAGIEWGGDGELV